MNQAEFDKLFDTWVTSVNETWLDLDGYPKGHPWQCHDVWLSFITVVMSLSIGDGYAPSDYTDSVFTQFPLTKALGAKFTKHAGTSGVRRGDVLFWAYGDPAYKLSHVAVALGGINNDNDTVPSLTQNPGKTHGAHLPVSNMIGYLRPVITPTIKERKVVVKSYLPKEGKRQTIAGGGYKLIGISDGDALGRKRATSLLVSTGSHILLGQANLSGEPGTEVELAMAVDTTNEDGSKVLKSRFIVAETDTLGELDTRIHLTTPVSLAANERVRLYLRHYGKPVQVTFVRWTVAK